MVGLNLMLFDGFEHGPGGELELLGDASDRVSFFSEFDDSWVSDSGSADMLSISLRSS